MRVAYQGDLLMLVDLAGCGLLFFAIYVKEIRFQNEASDYSASHSNLELATIEYDDGFTALCFGYGLLFLAALFAFCSFKLKTSTSSVSR